MRARRCQLCGRYPQLVQNTLEAQKKHNIAVAVLGTYVELAIADEVQRSANAADFKSQLAVCKALNAGCIGTETTGMHKQPAGTTRERAQYMLCKKPGNPFCRKPSALA